MIENSWSTNGIFTNKIFEAQMGSSKIWWSWSTNGIFKIKWLKWDENLKIDRKYCENFVTKLNEIYHKNFVSWMLWELRLMIEIGNILRTSSLDRTRNVARTSSRGRIRNVMRTASRDMMKNIVRTTSQVRIMRTMSLDRIISRTIRSSRGGKKKFFL